MPPKCKFTKEEITAVALDMVRETGIDAVTARALGTRLGASSKPIFSVFEGMDALHDAIIKAAREVYNGYVREGLSQPLPFKGVGMAYIRFAKEEPRLFQLLFMTERREKTDVLGVLPLIDDNYGDILSSVRDTYGIGDDDAKALYRHLWIHTHGIATLLANGVCSFETEEIDSMITDVFRALLIEVKRSGKGGTGVTQ